MGTIVILVVYLLTSLSLPVFMWRRHRPMFSPVRHVVPALGSAVLIVPFVELCQPGQPSPYSALPFVAPGLLAGAAGIAGLTVHRHPAAGSSEAAPAPAPLSSELIFDSAGSKGSCGWLRNAFKSEKRE